jgi:murein DD-endopeptidase MepM/ murein hydrolase activator NlpD
MLDEIAFGGGVIDSEAERPHRQAVDPARIVKGVLLSPLSLLKLCFKLIAVIFKRADFALLKEMRKFLAHPGHFFWFNRLAPQAASRHFGTSSTDAMTHHARRFGAHTAMLLLAIMVVAFGGFSGLTRPIVSPEEMQAAPDGSTPYGTLAQIGNMHEIFITAINSGTAEPRRTKVHEVAAGDTIKKLAERYGISVDSILYANLLVDPDATLQTGQKLLIPPTTGMLHIANQGDTIGKLADIYQVDPLTIINYPLNNLAGADIKTQLQVGQEVIVPNGVMPLRDKLYIYTTKPGDTVSSVAAKFGISTYTLRVANDLDNSDGLLPDVELDILPISGIQYTIRPGDTLQGIATRYSVPLESIVNYAPNNVAKGLKLEAGRTIIIPNGIVPAPPPTPKPQPTATPKPAAPAVNNNKPTTNNNSAAKPATNNSATKPAAKQPAAPAAKQPSLGSSGSVAKAGSSAPAPAPSGGIATGSMMWPIRGVITTYFGQRIWYGIHMGLDIATGCGTPTVAADGGTVIESGWSPYGYGINVQIDHGRGIVTRYGHFMATKVVVGQRVSKGQLIGLEGTTGNSTGCHVHFEVKVNGRYTDPLGWIH